MMQNLADEEDEEDAAETEKELDVRMKEFEELMDRRPFLVNEVLIRRNPNDVQEWEKRVALWGEDDEKVSTSYFIRSRIIPSSVSGCGHIHQSIGDRCALERLPPTCIGYMLALPSTTRRAAPAERPNLTSTVHGRSSRRGPK